MELRKIDNSEFMSTLVTSRSCKSKTRFLCIQDLLKANKVEKKANLACLQPPKMGSQNGEKNIGRSRRDANDGMTIQTEKLKNSKIVIFINK